MREEEGMEFCLEESVSFMKKVSFNWGLKIRKSFDRKDTKTRYSVSEAA